MIATKNAGILEHIGENGIWIDNDSTEQIVEQIEKLLASEDLRRLFREFKKSENKDLRAEGHRAAKALLSNDAKVFKKDFFAIYLACNRLGAG